MDFGEVFVLSITGILGTLIVLWSSQRFYFKRWDRQWELEQYKAKEENKRKNKRLKMKATLNTKPPATTSDILGLLKNVDKDKIGGILEAFSNTEEGVEDNELVGLLDNPVVQNIIKGIGQGGVKKESDEDFEG